MDPLSAATAFASIVGLLADFRSQRKDAAEADYQEFMTWLAEQRHEELKALIEQSAATAIWDQSVATRR